MGKDWLGFRKDNFLSGKSKLIGNLNNPKIYWSNSLGGYVRDMYSIVNDDGTKDIIYVSGGRITRKNISGSTIWNSTPRGIEGLSFICDLDGDNIQEICATNGRELLVYSSIDGSLLFNHYFGPPQSSGAVYSMIIQHKFDKTKESYKVLVGLWSSREVLVFNFQNGVKEGYLEHTIDVRDGFHPTIVAADLDNCGKDEIVVTKRGAIYYIDPDSGNVKKSIDWISGGERRRNYGFFKLADINKDGNLECVVASSLVTRHLSMIENDSNGNLSVKWDRFIEHIYPTDTTEVRHCYNSLSDVDGDGFLELVLSLYNTRGDKCWYTEIINPINGEIKYELKDIYIWGLNDIDNDGVYEIFGSKETSRTTKEYSDTYLIKFQNGNFEKILQNEKAKFATRFINSTSDLSIFRLEFLPDDIWVFKNKNVKGFITVEYLDNLIKVYINYLNGQKLEIYNSDIRSNLHISLVDDLNNDDIDEILLADCSGFVKILQSDGRIISTFEASNSLPLGMFGQNKPSLNPTYFIDEKNNTTFFAISNLSNTFNLYKYDESTKLPEKHLTIDGVGKRGWNCNQNCIYISKINNEPFIIYASPSKDYSKLIISDISGNTVKEFDFPDFPTPKYNNRLGLYEWIVIDEKILLASLYKSYSMNSEETFAFDINTKKLLWHIKEVGSGEYGRGFGAYGFTSCYKDTSNTLHTFFLAKDTFCHFDANTGVFIHPPLLLKELTEKVLKEKGILDISDASLATYTDPFSAYGSITIADINNDGINELLFLGCFNAIGALDINHNLIWWNNAPLSDLCMRYPGLCDIDNDGELEIGVSHINGEFICYSAKNGKEKWKINLSSTASDIVCCDIDNDGYYEFIFGTSDGKLLALGDKGNIKFELHFDTSVGNPIICDLDNDNQAEILVVTGDSKIHWIK